MKAVKEIRSTKLVFSNYTGNEKPKYKIGTWLTIYSGRDEGLAFVVKDIRFNLDTGKFEYLRDGTWGTEWFQEGSVTGNHHGGHYDSRGYCDNPGRGY